MKVVSFLGLQCPIFLRDIAGGVEMALWGEDGEAVLLLVGLVRSGVLPHYGAAELSIHLQRRLTTPPPLWNFFNH